VRELKNSSYPQIKGLEFSLFQEQLDFLQKNYHFIKMEELIYSYENKIALPEKSVILTFDDGYSDHFKYVFPELQKRGIEGSFYVPGQPVKENTLLDVNKIHYILATAKNDEQLIQKSMEQLNLHRDEYNLESFDYYFSKLGTANRFDSSEVTYFKRLLQKELPVQLRNKMTSALFEEFVGMSEQEFSKELYMNTAELKEMISNGMHIGHHGYTHCWLNSISEDDQRIEIEKGCSFLKELGINMDLLTICYPYGAYSESVINLLKEFKFKLGFTSRVDLADPLFDNCFEIPRLDTNDIPKSGVAVPNHWYEAIA
jgi:peptidoglycan/xylan/chitin deacetylase (PgdA/CDA1 family)